MKKTLLFIALATGFNFASAQTVFDNFNTAGTRANYWNYYGSSYITAPVANPATSTVNSSTEVGQYTRFVPAATNDEFQGLGCKQAGWVSFDFFASYNTVNLDVYAAQAFSLSLVLQDNGGTNVDVLTLTQNYAAGDVNTWKTLTFDFSSVNEVGNANYHELASGQGYALLLKFDDGLMNTVARDYFVDNFTGTTTVATGILSTQTNTVSQLNQNMPNPLSDVTAISYSLKESAQVSLNVFDTKGIQVASLVNNQFQGTGDYSYNLNAAALQEGIYYYSIQAGNFVETKRMVVKK